MEMGHKGRERERGGGEGEKKSNGMEDERK